MINEVLVLGSKQEVKDLVSFIKKAQEVHGDKYDYSQSIYTRACDKLTIRCIKHNTLFEMKPNSHISAKQGCPLCATEKSGLSCKKPLEYYLQKSREVHGDKYNYSLITDIKVSKDKVPIICESHGVFYQSLSDHSYGKGCRRCAAEATGDRTRSTVERFLEKAYLVHGDRYDYSKINYTKAHCYLDIICRDHGEFRQRADHHLTTQGCPKCMAISKGDLYRFTKEEYIERARKVHGDKYDYSLVDYFNSQTKINIICREHGVFSQVPNSHLYVGGCPVCSTQKVGYRSNMSGTFYILKVTENIYKFGITNNFDKRLKGINSKSIFDSEPLYTFSSENGLIIRQLESEIIASSIRRGVINREDMLSGYTETFYSEDLNKVLDVVYKYFPPT